jgi:hypothetical protein
MLPPLGSIAFGCPVRAHAKPARRGIVEVTAEGQIRDDDTDTDSEAFGQPSDSGRRPSSERRKAPLGSRLRRPRETIQEAVVAAEDVLQDDAAVVVLALNGTQ